MPVRKLYSHSPYPGYVNDVTNFLARLRLYTTLRSSAIPDVVQVGSLYQSQLDDTKAWLDARYANLLVTIQAIRGSANTNPVVIIDPVVAPPSTDISDFTPGTTVPKRVKTSGYKSRECQAVKTPSGLPKISFQPKGKLPGKILPIFPKPIPILPRPRPRPIWPPWPPLPPPAPIANWYPVREEKYSLAYAHYWCFDQLYNADPVDRTDLRALAYFSVNFWLNYYDLYRATNNEAAAKQMCISGFSTLQDALC